MNKEVQDLLFLIKENPIDFKKFSSDIQQINPTDRMNSIYTIISTLDIPKNTTLLDIGTGYGYGAVLLNKMGYNVIGLESNKEKLEEGMRYWNSLDVEFEEITSVNGELGKKGNLYFLNRDARKIEDIPNDSIGLATSFFISWYMVGKNNIFSDVKRILQPRSNLIISTDGPYQLPEFLRKPIVDISSKLVNFKGLKHTSTKTIDNSNVHDKYVLTYR